MYSRKVHVYNSYQWYILTFLLPSSLSSLLLRHPTPPIFPYPSPRLEHNTLYLLNSNPSMNPIHLLTCLSCYLSPCRKVNSCLPLHFSIPIYRFMPCMPANKYSILHIGGSGAKKSTCLQYEEWRLPVDKQLWWWLRPNIMLTNSFFQALTTSRFPYLFHMFFLLTLVQKPSQR